MSLTANYTMSDLHEFDIIRLKDEWVEDRYIAHPAAMDCFLGKTMMILHMTPESFKTTATDEWVFAPSWVDTVIKTERVKRPVDVIPGDYIVQNNKLYIVQELNHDVSGDVILGYVENVLSHKRAQITMQITDYINVFRPVGAAAEQQEINIQLPTEQEFLGFLFGARK